MAIENNKANVLFKNVYFYLKKYDILNTKWNFRCKNILIKNVEDNQVECQDESKRMLDFVQF